MKKYLLVITISFLVFAVLNGCSKQIAFDGSRTSNHEQFIMEYTVLNDTKTHEMELKQGAIIDVNIEDLAGHLDIIVEKINGDEIYRGNNASTGKFSIEIPNTGTYLFTVTGSEAKGSVSFKVRNN